MIHSALYRGIVTHRRLKPKAHFLKYRVFQLLLDLDEAPALSAASRLFAFNRPALLSFHETDHGDGSGTPLKTQVESLCRAKGLGCGGPVRVLCLPRVLGYVFNPITLYFVHDPEARLCAVVHEVNNTFGERCFYVLPAHAGPVIDQRAEKTLYVSPFMDMDYGYRFRLSPPGETFALSIALEREGELWLTANMAFTRRAFTDGQLLLAWARHPLLTLKVIVGIHFEALRLWLKGVGYRSHPKRAEASVKV